jgi:hypothetical protein
MDMTNNREDMDGESPSWGAMPGSIDKNFNIVFYGCGEVAEAAVREICSTETQKFNNVPVNIFLLGEEKTRSNREKIVGQSTQSQRKGWKVEVVAENAEYIEDILPHTDLFFLTANKSPKDEKNRVKMLNHNKTLIDDLDPFFDKNFEGIINIVTNLPEGLAQYAATRWDLNDPRQITAHVPLDLMRFEMLVQEMLLKGQSYKALDLVVAGYHDLPFPVINGSLVIIGVVIEL